MQYLNDQGRILWERILNHAGTKPSRRDFLRELDCWAIRMEAYLTAGTFSSDTALDAWSLSFNASQRPLWPVAVRILSGIWLHGHRLKDISQPDPW